MKKFLFRFLLFLLPIIVVAFVLEGLIRNIPNDYVLKKKYLDKHAPEIETLVLGSSHAFYGVNPAYLPDNSFNASYVSQSLEYDLAILKKYEKEWKSLESVILPLSYFSLFFSLEDETDNWRIKNYNLYYDLNSSYRPSDYSEIFSRSFKASLLRVYAYYYRGEAEVYSTPTGWGFGYTSGVEVDLEKAGLEAANRHTAPNFKRYQESLQILRSIAEFCRQRNVQLLLFTPPAYQSYSRHLQEQQLESTIAAAWLLAAQFENCTYLNLLDSPAFQREDFFDADHVNDQGAKKLTSLLKKQLEHKPLPQVAEN